ncbi:MAG: U32 family peptidase [Oscillospiraceae bacterium]|nr:U32 family peptidase [Oscillospiraceae bacterium]
MGIRPELLSPAGDPERLRMALTFGANAVYLSGKQYGMRGACGNFDEAALRDAVRLCHKTGARVHVTVNTLPRDEEMAALPSYLELLSEIGADALIVADLGVFNLARRYAPHCELHISTQAGVVNSAAAEGWFDLGAKRVVLAREMSLEEIAHLRRHTPRELELETFVHGSMCVSFSGRCLLSNYMTGRDGNRGVCAQPCRWKYALMEETRPGQYFPISEAAEGTYILNSKDLCMIDHIPALLEAGIDALKIEGRNKSSYYTAIVTNAYQHAIEAAMAGTPLAPVWREETEKVSHRNYYTGFYFGTPGNSQFYGDSRYVRDWQISAIVVSCGADGAAVLTQRNRFCVGDTLELVTPDAEPVALIAEAMTDGEGTPLTVCPHPQQEIHMKLPRFAPPDSILRRKVAVDTDAARR